MLYKVKECFFGANNILIEIYIDDYAQKWIKRVQIGKALNYAYPGRSMSRLHYRNKDVLDPFSIKEYFTDVGQEYVFYNLEGIKLVCSISDQDNSFEFLDWIIDNAVIDRKIDV